MDDAALAQRFGAIEEQLKLISQHLGVDCPPFAGAAGAAGDGDAGAAGGTVPTEVLELAQAGKEIQAISRLRQLTGMTLVEAKRIVDGL
jgi:ribosomal protein L7/L12